MEAGSYAENGPLSARNSEKEAGDSQGKIKSEIKSDAQPVENCENQCNFFAKSR
jgi:hypothetical protein